MKNKIKQRIDYCVLKVYDNLFTVVVVCAIIAYCVLTINL